MKTPTSNTRTSAGRRSRFGPKVAGMADAVVDACRINLLVWERYFNGIGEEGDRVAA